MNRTKLIAMLGLGLGLSGLGCGTATDGTSLTPDGLPPLTAEEQAARDNMDKNTLATIDLPEGQMKFVEYSPGEVSIMRQIKIGAPVTRVPGESSMKLDEIFRAYAPGREVPPAVVDAMGRVQAHELAVANLSVEPAGPASMNEGVRVPLQTVAKADGTENVTSALASSVDQAWFTNTFCHVYGADFSWCWAIAWQGAYASKRTHRSNSVTCGDTGSARVNMYVGTALKKNFDVPYGQCWYSGAYHHSHGLLGVNNEITQLYQIQLAQSTVRFAGWMADEDQFISGF
jgi:hypothetical protein